MTEEKQIFDVIIVGQGIAGTLLHDQLTARGKSVLVIDNHFKSNSSLVAAGMFNPIVFKRLNKSWKADTLLPKANEIYSSMQEKLGKQILFPLDIIRVFANHEQQNDWYARSGEVGYTNYLTNKSVGDLTNNNIDVSFGYGVLKEGGWVNLDVMLNEYRSKLKDANQLLEEAFDYNQLVIKENKLLYKEIKAQSIIFCEGNLVRNNPWFNHLPFTLTKGELLTIRIGNLDTDKILNKGFFVLPVGNNIYKVGATYNWKDKTDTPTEEAKEELLKKLQSLLDHPFELIGHQAGVRPTTKDRRPIIGTHPKHQNLHVFNGLGTKGVMIAPYFVDQFCDFLEGKSQLDKEVDLNRFNL